MDDGLILAKDPETVMAALAFIARLLAAVGYELHPEKTSQEPINLETTRLQFLGKWYQWRRVITPWSRLSNLTKAMQGCELGSRAHRAAALAIHRELALDEKESKDRTLRFVQLLVPEHFTMLREVERQWACERKLLLHAACACVA